MLNRTAVCLTVLLLFLALPAAAQQTMFGVKGGVVVADVSVENVPDLSDPDTRKDIVAGAFLQVPIAGNISLQPEILFIRKGFESPDASAADLRLDYVQVPLLIQYHLLSAGPVTPRLYAGPSLGFEAACTLFGSDVEGAEAESDCADENIDTESADFGIAFGGGVDVSLGTIVVTGDVRYDLGVTNINGLEDEGSAKNRAWEFMAGIGIPFGP